MDLAYRTVKRDYLSVNSSHWLCLFFSFRNSQKLLVSDVQSSCYTNMSGKNVNTTHVYIYSKVHKKSICPFVINLPQTGGEEQ